MTQSDAIVIGAGMAGASFAYEAAAGLQVQVLERESQPGYHATGRSAAAFIPSYGYDNTALRLLTQCSRAFFDSPPQGFADSPLLQQRGLLTLATASTKPGLATELQQQQRWFANVQPTTTADAMAKAPLLHPDTVAEAFFEPDVHDIEVAALHQGYLRGLKQRGGVLRCNQDIRSIKRQHNTWVVRTQASEFRAPLLINAAGAWGDTIAHLAGVRPLGLTPLRRTVILFRLPEGTTTTDWPLVLAANGNYCKPDAGGLLFSPADEHPSPACDAIPEEIDVAVAADLAQRLLRIDNIRISHQWAGLRTFAPDRTPVVGFDANVEGFFWLCGQGGHGIQTAPAMAQLAAAMAQRAQAPTQLSDAGFEASWLAPLRFGG